MKAELCLTFVVVISCSACTARTPPVIAEQHDQVNLSDTEFARLMTTHHRVVMDIALMDGGRGKSPDLKAFATTVWQSRSRDVFAWEAFGGQAPKLSEGAANQERAMLDAHRLIVEYMKSADSTELDELFVREMRRLGQVAAEMIEETAVRDPGLQKLAAQFAEAQRTELATLHQLQQAAVARR